MVVQGTNNGTVTDLDGNYQLTVADEADTLVFSYVGYATQNIAIGNRTTINVEMSTGAKMLEDQIVVVGYGQVQKSDLTGSVSRLEGEEVQAVPSQSPLQGLQGKLAGVQVTLPVHREPHPASEYGVRVL